MAEHVTASERALLFALDGVTLRGTDVALIGVGVQRDAGDVSPGAIKIPRTRQMAIATAAIKRRLLRRGRRRCAAR
jgi:hypothetical protein